MSLQGTPGLAGPVDEATVRCSWPDLDGLGIAVVAQPPDGSSVVRVQLLPGRVQVHAGAGTGPDYAERVFEGRGVTSFDASGGAQVRSSLTETTAAPPASTAVGAVTDITASIDCGDQTPGRSTVTLTGETPSGPVVSARLDPVRVECDLTPQGTEVTASGVLDVGGTDVLVSLGLLSDGSVTVNKSTADGSSQYSAFGDSTIGREAARVRADVIEEDVTAGRTLHVEGELTCGRNAAG